MIMPLTLIVPAGSEVVATSVLLQVPGIGTTTDNNVFTTELTNVTNGIVATHYACYFASIDSALKNAIANAQGPWLSIEANFTIALQQQNLHRIIRAITT